MTKKKNINLGFWIKILLFLAVLILGASLSSKFILTKALESAIGAPVKISKFHFDLFSSQVGIYGLEIKNPLGFQEPTLASLPELFIQVNLPAFFQNRVHIREIRLNLDEITVERNSNGAVNLTEIGAVKKPRTEPAEGRTPGGVSPSEPQRPTPAQKAGPTNVQIDKVVLSLGRARYVDRGGASPTIRTFSLEIKNAVLRNVTNPAEITQQIVIKTLQRAGLSVLTQNLQQYGIKWDAEAANVPGRLKETWEDLKGKLFSVTAQ